MNFYCRIIFILIASLMATHALSQDVSGWSDKTICRLAKATPDNVEYQAESTKRGLSCGGSNTATSSASSQKVAKALAGIDIENDPNVDFFMAPFGGYYPAFQIKEAWQMGDFNNDGYVDVIYVGSMKYDAQNMVGEDTGGLCGGGECKGNKPLPQLFLGDENRKLTRANELLIDNREDPGMSLGKDILVADYNNDGVLDFYIYDHGVGTHDGFRDSYFLSQSNGTWLESSSTHLSHPNFQVFDHGGAVGDIDNDGDMDVVITESNWKTGTLLWCLVNDGTGFLKKRKCGGEWSFALELADMNGDGYLDVILGSQEWHTHFKPFTGIIWNDGRGNFNKNNKTNLQKHKKLGGIPEVSAADLDGDGDLDIVYSRVGELYVGTAVSIIENLGNKKFKDHGLIHLLEAPADYVPDHEGNPYNAFISMVKFRDLDKDGDMDIYLGGSAHKTNGMVLLNEGDFNFDLLKPNEAKYLTAK